MSLRPLNQQTAKSQFRALLTFTKDRSRYSLTFTKDEYHLFFELGGFSTSYVIATSELADSQVSSTIELSGVSIGYVIATSEPADS